ncbi:hypothetical protein N1851_006006 [Merluccius polli]|uniref:Secreted protein n=1 Tax=Merluccius polli TaxID=89951 RepID=A0AA47P9R2_MERPO|nr:hypothetical protein N1851_006006 [Merluccius polli]
MQTLVHKTAVVFILLSLVRDFEVQALPVPGELSGLLVRTRRSLLWRWNSLKPSAFAVGFALVAEQTVE